MITRRHWVQGRGATRRPTAVRVAALALALVWALPLSGRAQIQDARGITRIVSLNALGFQGNNHSGAYAISPLASDSAPSITPNARFVAFTSRATNFPAGGVGSLAAQTDGQQEVYVRDRDLDGDGILEGPGSSTLAIVSLRSDNSRGNGGSMWPAMTPNGRFVAFTSFASNLVDEIDVRYLDKHRHGDNTVHTHVVFARGNGMADVFVRDRDLDGNGVYDEPCVGCTRTVRVSVASDGTQAEFPHPPDLGPPDEDSPAYIAYCQANPCDTPLTAVPASSAASISADGRFVAFYSYAPNLVQGDANDCGPIDHPRACADVFVHDRDADGDGIFDEPGAIATELASVSMFGGSGNDQSGDDPFTNVDDPVPGVWLSRAPAISANGRHVAYQSWASDLVSFDTNTMMDVFVRDRVAATTVRVSATEAGTQGFLPSYHPSISGDGSLVLFESRAALAGDSAGPKLYLRDRDADADGIFDEAGAVTLKRANLNSAGGPMGGGGTSTPLLGTISASGRYIGWQGPVPVRTLPSGNPGTLQVYVRDRQTGVTTVASVSPEGILGQNLGLLGDGQSLGIAVSDVGWSAFISRATNLASNDANLCPTFTNGPFNIPMPNGLPACADVFVRLPGDGICLESPRFCPFSDRV